MYVLMNPEEQFRKHCKLLAEKNNDIVIFFKDLKTEISKIPAEKKPRILKNLTFNGHANQNIFGEKNLTPKDFVSNLIAMLGDDIKYVETINLMGCEIGEINKQNSYALEVLKELRKHKINNIKIRAINNLVFETSVKFTRIYSSHGKTAISGIPTDKSSIYETELKFGETEIKSSFSSKIKKITDEEATLLIELAAIPEDKKNIVTIKSIHKQLYLLNLKKDALIWQANLNLDKFRQKTHKKYRVVKNFSSYGPEEDLNDNFKLEVLEQIFALHPAQQSIIIHINNVLAQLMSLDFELKHKRSSYAVIELSPKIHHLIALYTNLRAATYTAFDNPEIFAKHQKMLQQFAIENHDPLNPKFNLDLENLAKLISERHESKEEAKLTSVEESHEGKEELKAVISENYAAELINVIESEINRIETSLKDKLGLYLTSFKNPNLDKFMSNISNAIDAKVEKIIAIRIALKEIQEADEYKLASADKQYAMLKEACQSGSLFEALKLKTGWFASTTLVNVQNKIHEIDLQISGKKKFSS